MSPRGIFVTLLAVFAIGATNLGPARAQTPAVADSAHPLPSGLELLHLTPAGQPPLGYLDPTTFGQLRDQFNADTAFTRIALLLSPS